MGRSLRGGVTEGLNGILNWNENADDQPSKIRGEKST